MAAWKTVAHLEDHYGWHRREFRTRSIEDFDASAQETITLGTRFTYRDHTTGESRVGYFHRDSSRFVATDLAAYIVTHFQTDEFYVVTLPLSTYQD